MVVQSIGRRWTTAKRELAVAYGELLNKSHGAMAMGNDWATLYCYTNDSRAGGLTRVHTGGRYRGVGNVLQRVEGLYSRGYRIACWNATEACRR